MASDQAGIEAGSQPVRPAAEALLGAEQAITRSIGIGPALSGSARGWERVSLSLWNVYTERCECAPFSEILIALQMKGPNLRAKADGRFVNGSSAPGFVTIIPPAMPLTWYGHGQLESCTLHLPMSQFERLLNDDSSREVSGIALEPGCHDALLASVILALVGELRNPVEQGPLYAETLADTAALQVLHRVRRAATGVRVPRALPRRTLERVLECLESSLTTGVSIGALAEVAGYSRAHFSRAFRHSTGMTPHQFLRHRRIERAKLLLSATGYPIVEIAMRSGFASQAHFTECFRAATGTTPRVYRNAHC